VSIDQSLIAGILAKTFSRGSLIRQGLDKTIEFSVLAASITSNLNKCEAIHTRAEQIDAKIVALQDEKDKLIHKCEHFAKRITMDAGGIKTIFCQVCGKTFDELELDIVKSNCLRSGFHMVLSGGLSRWPHDHLHLLSD